MTVNTPGCQLFLVTPPKIDIPAFRPLLARALQAAPVASVLLQLDSKDDADWIAGIEALMPLAQDAGTAFLLARRADLAREYGADGVQLGSSDMHIEEARELLGDDAIIGAICGNSRHAAMNAGDAGADYISFGPFFEKDHPLDILTWWHELMEVPAVAFGNITAENLAEIAGVADFIVPDPALWNTDMSKALATFNGILQTP